MLFDAADAGKQQSVIDSTPVNDFGIPCIYPQIPSILPYHNNAVWPFVESYWAMASAKTGNETSLTRAIAAIYRPAALWLTNKENFVASDGDFAGTQINSSNMLWSLSGNIALVYKILFGIHYNQNSLEFKPFVTKGLVGERSLNHFKYRDAVLDIEMSGYGNRIKKISLDGKIMIKALFPGDLKGNHHIKIVLANNAIQGKSKLVPGYTAPETPVIAYAKNELRWSKAKNAVSYRLLKGGKPVAVTKALTFKINDHAYAEYQVIAIDRKGVPSFASEPVSVVPSSAKQIIEAETIADKSDLPYQGFTGKGFIEVNTTINTQLNIPINIATAGTYVIDLRYVNGNGPINTENKCAIRTLIVDHSFAGTIVLPQRGKGEWSNWGYSNVVKVKLTKGKHIISLCFKNANENMNINVNQAMIDHFRLTRVGNN